MSGNSTGYLGQGFFLFKNPLDGPSQPPLKFKASKEELTITFSRTDLMTLKSLSNEQNSAFELLAYNVDLSDYEGNPFDGIARLKTTPGNTIGSIVDKLNDEITLTGWLPAMEEHSPPGPPVTRWFLPTFIVQMKNQEFSAASATIENEENGWGLDILRRFWLPGFYSISLPKAVGIAQDENYFKTLYEYNEKQEVKYAYFDEISSKDNKHVASTDPHFAQGNGGWHHSSSDSDEIYSSTAWDQTKGHHNVVIAVVDTGVRYTHNDFDVKPEDLPTSWPSSKFTTNWSYDSGGSNDTDGHGTKVAGVAASFANFAPEAGFGVAGVAPHCRIARIKIPLGDSTTYAEYANGIQFVKQKAIEYTSRRYIALLCWDTGGSNNSLIRTAIEEAHNVGVLVIASAGENNSEIGPGHFQQYPAVYPDVLAVGCYKKTTKARHQATNFGLSVVMAPGESIAAPSIASDTAITTNNGGTSIAAAIIAGIAALAWSKDISTGGSRRTNVDIKKFISDNANTHVISGYNNRGRPFAHQVLNLV